MHRRGFALLLLVTLLGGGLVLPLVDAMVFHAGRLSVPAERTLAGQGGAPAHLQVCAVTHAVKAGGAPPAGAPVLEILRTSVYAALPQFTAFVPTPFAYPPALPRAPPVVLA